MNSLDMTAQIKATKAQAEAWMSEETSEKIDIAYA